MVVWHRGGRMVTKGRGEERRKHGKEEEKGKKWKRIEKCTEVNTGRVKARFKE